MLKIFTLSWNGEEKLSSLYKSLLPCLKDIDWAWGIKDNGSKDNTAQLVSNWDDQRVKYFPYPNNTQNYSQGNNWLFDNMEIKDDDLILLLNNDIIFKDHTSLKNMIKIISNDKEVGIVGCKLNYEDRPNVIQHAGVLFHPQNIGTPFHYRAGEIEEARDRRNRYYPIVTGAVLLTTANIYKNIRFNEKLQWCWDDSYFSLDVQDKGYKVVYCGETNILHSESASLKKNPVNKLFFTQNLKIFIDRWKDQIDKSLVQKYAQDQNFALY
jgi:GT2 family glycosyltransferase